MRVAALYDIHGNLPALESVLAEVAAARVDRIIVGGDVLPGPMPVQSLALLGRVDLPIDYLAGNGEVDTLAARDGAELEHVPEAFRAPIHWVGGQLSDRDAEAISAWPKTVRLDIPGLGSVLFCHATPRSDREIFTEVTPEAPLLPIFDTTDAHVVVCGHTHMPFDRSVGGTRVVNAGSVGMPFGPAGADWLLLGGGIEARRTEYDLERAAERVRATAYPGAAEFAQGNIVSPPRAEDMRVRFERAALR